MRFGEFSIQSPEPVDEVEGQAKQNDGIGLVDERDDDVDIGKDGQYAEGNLQGDNAS